jgi:hypothetical protein
MTDLRHTGTFRRGKRAQQLTCHFGRVGRDQGVANIGEKTWAGRRVILGIETVILTRLETSEAPNITHTTWNLARSRGFKAVLFIWELRCYEEFRARSC